MGFWPVTSCECHLNPQTFRISSHYRVIPLCKMRGAMFFFCWFPKRLPGVYNSAAWATVSTICRLGGKVCGCWLVATHGNSSCQCWGVEELRYYVELSSFSFQHGRILEHVEKHKTSNTNCHFISRSTFCRYLYLYKPFEKHLIFFYIRTFWHV